MGDIGGPSEYCRAYETINPVIGFGVEVVGSGVWVFDTTSSVAGGTIESNISLVDPTIQFSRTKKRLVEWGASFTID